MKRLRLWIKELSLSQQLLGIIFIVVTVFVMFFFVFLSNNIDTFVEDVMHDQLHKSNDRIAYYLDNQLAVDDLNSINNKDTASVIYDVSSKKSLLINLESIDDTVIDSIINGSNINTGELYDGKTPLMNNQIYSVERYSEDVYIITFLSNTYRNQFRSSLANGVINLNILVISVLFIALMAWIGTIILPLTQIRNYIDKIRNDEPATLQINRHDEIGEVADALVSMEEDLEKQNKIKEEMIQNISHDLKTPIATIKSYTESIKDGIYPYGTIENSCDVIIENADRMDKKVRSLIMLNKMGYLNDTSDPGLNLDMKTVVEKTIMSLIVVKPEISIEPDLHEVYFHGEEEPWRIVIENLVDNALRYATTNIKIILRPGELQVINDGSHIDDSKLDSLFKPYETGSGGKFGLGLSIVDKVASTYGYHVKAENLNDGVCFRIWNNEQMKAQKKGKANQQEHIDDAQTKEIKSLKKADRERKKAERENRKKNKNKKTSTQ